MYDVVIVGGGTAGLTAAIYAARSGLSALLIERLAFGGQIINAAHISNYPGIKAASGFEFASNLHNQVVDFGVKTANETVLKIEDGETFKTVHTASQKIQCKSIIISIGAKYRPLGLDRENELIGAGISYCATCDGAFYRDKTVAVVGGGNTAIEDALFLSAYCKKVYLIHRREGFRAEQKQLALVTSKPNVELLTNNIVTTLEGTPSLSGIAIENTVTAAQSVLDIACLFVAIGRVPDSGPFSPPLDTDEHGYLVAGEDCKTNVPGIFAAGDCRTKTVRQLVTAAADGATAALAAAEYLS